MSCNTRLAPTTHRRLGRVSIASVFPPFTHLTPPPPTIFSPRASAFPSRPAQPSPAPAPIPAGKRFARGPNPACLPPKYTPALLVSVCVCRDSFEQPLLYSQSLSPRSSPDSRFLLSSFFSYSNKQLITLSSKRIRRAFVHIQQCLDHQTPAYPLLQPRPRRRHFLTGADPAIAPPSPSSARHHRVCAFVSPTTIHTTTSSSPGSPISPDPSRHPTSGTPKNHTQQTCRPNHQNSSNSLHRRIATTTTSQTSKLSILGANPSTMRILLLVESRSVLGMRRRGDA
ncbi:hypothetical protein CC79DRAFT_151707 [Sarocladium strictum]